MLTRKGTTLLETLVAVTVFGTVATAGLATLRSAARAMERTVLTGDRQSQLNGTIQATSALLHPLSPGDGDVIAATDTAIRFLGTILSGVACRVRATDTYIPDGALAHGVALGAASSMPQPGDLLVAWEEGPTSATRDDLWTRHRVTAVSTPSGGCVGGPLADPVADAASHTWRLSLVPPLDSLRVGAPIHLLRPQRLALYRSGSDWSLGHAEQTPLLPWSVIQPVTGPLQPPDGPSPGLRLDLLDSAGTPSTPGARQLHIRVAAPTRDSLRTTAGRQRPVATTVRQLALRNAR